MIYATRIYHRKDTNTIWYEQSSEYSSHLQKNYLETYKILKVAHEESSDKLSLISFTVFADLQAKKDFEADEICSNHMNNRESHNTTNNIISETPVIIEK